MGWEETTITKASLVRISVTLEPRPVGLGRDTPDVGPSVVAAQATP